MSRIVSTTLFLLAMVFWQESLAETRDQAKRMHDRLAGVPPTAEMLESMVELMGSAGSVDEGARAAALQAMQHPDFFRTTLKNFATPWTNRDADRFAALNDYSATIIGLVRDEVDFRQVLTTDRLYTGALEGVPAYSSDDNRHYEELERQAVDLGEHLVARSQAELLGIPGEAAAGVLTTRAAAKAFFIAGTNRAMFRFTLLNHLCVDLEQVADTTRPPDRIRQDVTRSPGGDSRLFRNNCVGCHSGMDPMAQAFAYYDYRYDSGTDPSGVSGRLIFNEAGTLDLETGTRVVAKYHFNENNFPLGYVTPNDDWENYWRSGRNRALGWDPTLPGRGQGARSLGRELASSEAFASCQVKKIFNAVCLRDPVDSNDRNQLSLMTEEFKASGYNLKQPFAASAAYCRGD